MITEEFCSVAVGRLRFGTRSFLLAWAVAVFSSGAGLAQPAAEPAEEAAAGKQNYEQLQVIDELKKKSVDIGGMLTNGIPAAQQQTFDDYYQKYLLARWTDPKNVTNLPGWRKTLRTSDLGRRGAATAAHEHLVALVLDFMKKLVAGPYHPAVQVNAMLMIGELNAVEQPPTPLPEALQAMMAAVPDTKVSDGVRVAALVGIGRHVAANLTDADARRTLTATLLKVAAEDLPAGMGRAGREWIRCLCLENLSHLGSPGENNAVFKLMAETVADSKLRLSTRATAAESLGRLDYAGAAGIKGAEAAAAIGQFLLDVCNRELPKAKDADTATGRQVQGRLQQCLTAALAGLVGGEVANRKGLISATPAAQQAFVGELQKTIEKAVDQLGKWKEGDDLEVPVSQLQNGLEGWLKKAK